MSLFADLTSSVNAVRPGRTTMPSVDISMLVVASALMLFGLLMVYSASIALADGPRYESYGRYYFVVRHGLFLLVAAGLNYWPRYQLLRSKRHMDRLEASA